MDILSNENDFIFSVDVDCTRYESYMYIKKTFDFIYKLNGFEIFRSNTITETDAEGEVINYKTVYNYYFKTDTKYVIFLNICHELKIFEILEVSLKFEENTVTDGEIEDSHAYTAEHLLINENSRVVLNYFEGETEVALNSVYSYRDVIDRYGREQGINDIPLYPESHSLCMGFEFKNNWTDRRIIAHINSTNLANRFERPEGVGVNTIISTYNGIEDWCLGYEDYPDKIINHCFYSPIEFILDKGTLNIDYYLDDVHYIKKVTLNKNGDMVVEDVNT